MKHKREKKTILLATKSGIVMTHLILVEMLRDIEIKAKWQWHAENNMTTTNKEKNEIKNEEKNEHFVTLYGFTHEKQLPQQQQQQRLCVYLIITSIGQFHIAFHESFIEHHRIERSVYLKQR